MLGAQSIAAFAGLCVMRCGSGASLSRTSWRVCVDGRRARVVVCQVEHGDKQPADSDWRLRSDAEAAAPD